MSEPAVGTRTGELGAAGRARAVTGRRLEEPSPPTSPRPAVWITHTVSCTPAKRAQPCMIPLLLMWAARSCAPAPACAAAPLTWAALSCLPPHLLQQQHRGVAIALRMLLVCAPSQPRWPPAREQPTARTRKPVARAQGLTAARVLTHIHQILRATIQKLAGIVAAWCQTHRAPRVRASAPRCAPVAEPPCRGLHRPSERLPLGLTSPWARNAARAA